MTRWGLNHDLLADLGLFRAQHFHQHLPFPRQHTINCRWQILTNFSRFGWQDLRLPGERCGLLATTVGVSGWASGVLSPVDRCFSGPTSQSSAPVIARIGETRRLESEGAPGGPDEPG